MNQGVVTIVAHDAGGAEVLSSWLKRVNRPFHLVLEGPAVTVFRRKIGSFSNSSLGEAISLSDWVLCGTSWQSDLEKRAITLAKLSNKKCVVFLDHWVNYANRFEHNGECLIPDEIWVGDRYAQKLAEKSFSYLPVSLVENPYFLDLQERFSALQIQETPTNQVLYVCEPIREHALLVYGNERHWGYTEEDALVFFLQNLSYIDTNIEKVIIRPHPSERHEKYNWAALKHPELVTISLNTTLEEDIARCSVVAGCSSMALVVGLIAGKRAISTIPAGGHPCELPHAEIEHLQKMTPKD